MKPKKSTLLELNKKAIVPLEKRAVKSLKGGGFTTISRTIIIELPDPITEKE